MVAKPCACNRLSAALSMLGSSSTTATMVPLFRMKCLGFRLTGKPSQAQIFDCMRIYDRIFLGEARRDVATQRHRSHARHAARETERFARGLPANNAVAVGARGVGKSSLVKALHATVNATHGRCKGGDGQLKLIEFVGPRKAFCEMQSTQPQ